MKKILKLTKGDLKKLAKQVIDAQVNKIEDIKIELVDFEISSGLENNEEVVYSLKVEPENNLQEIIEEDQKNKNLKDKLITFFQKVRLNHIVAVLCVPVGIVITKESTNAFGYFFGLPLGLLYSLSVTMISMRLAKAVSDMEDFKN
jgi:hypothetical protein